MALQAGGTVTITFPTFHPDQVRAFYCKSDARGGAWDENRGRFKAMRCGRRWGKTDFGKTWIGDGAIQGHPVGWFAPDYKRLSEVYEELKLLLEPIISKSNKTDGVIRLVTGGRIDFWTLLDEDAGRSRMYKKVFIDEAAFTKPATMMNIWRNSIKPTLGDLNGRCIVASNTNGNDPENFLWQICNEAQYEFVEFHAPSWNNPWVPRPYPGEGTADWLARQAAYYDNLRKREHPLVFAQEYAAEFVDWSGVSFFDLEKLLVNGQPVEYPIHCDAVFAVIDSATKTGKDNDGTAVSFFARSRFGAVPLTILDWDVIQIEGALLETWLPGILHIGEGLAAQCGASAGFLGAFIEDKDSGQVLLQQAARRNPPLPAFAIESDLTAKGKDERALSVSGYVYRGEVKFSRAAFDKTTTYKTATRNHLRSQITGFRMGDKAAATRADDLLDTFTYGVAIGLGDSEGH